MLKNVIAVIYILTYYNAHILSNVSVPRFIKLEQIINPIVIFISCTCTHSMIIPG